MSVYLLFCSKHILVGGNTTAEYKINHNYIKKNMSEIKDTKAYSINDILNWNDNKELLLSPKYQRNQVWNQNAKSYLIDTIIRGYPIPQIFIRQTIDINTRQTFREIIDGQQRTRTIIEFTQNLFPILKSHNKEFGGLYYENLDNDIKEQILHYNISVEIIKIKDDARIYEMFARLNTNNMALNKQELRNAQFWGEFKVFVYRKSSEFKNLFIENKIFKHKDLMRMIDVEFFNSLIIHLMEGITTDSSKKTDTYYKKYDKEIEDIDEVEFKLNRILELIERILEDNLFTSKIFLRKSYFYTLFCVLNHQLFHSLDNDIQVTDTFNNASIDEHLNNLINKLSIFESELNSAIYDLDDGNDPSVQKYLIFEKYHRTRTTSKAERKERIKILSDFISV